MIDVAAGIGVTLQIDQVALNRVLTGPGGPVAQDMLRRGRAVANLAKRLCPVDTGRLRASIGEQLIFRGNQPIVQVGTNVRYAIFVHSGTGLYGPNRRPIRPRSAQVLRFKSKTGQIVYAKEVRGMPAREFLKNALPAAAR